MFYSYLYIMYAAFLCVSCYHIRGEHKRMNDILSVASLEKYHRAKMVSGVCILVLSDISVNNYMIFLL